MAAVHTVSQPRRLLYQYINYMLIKRIFLASPMVYPCCRARIIISIWKTQPLETHESIKFCSTSFLYSLKYKWHNKISTKPRFAGRLIKTILHIILLFTNCHALQCVIQSHISCCSHVFWCLLIPSSGSFIFSYCLFCALSMNNSQHSTKEENLRKNIVHFVG